MVQGRRLPTPSTLVQCLPNSVAISVERYKATHVNMAEHTAPYIPKQLWISAMHTVGAKHYHNTIAYTHNICTKIKGEVG